MRKVEAGEGAGGVAMEVIHVQTHYSLLGSSFRFHILLSEDTAHDDVTREPSIIKNKMYVCETRMRPAATKNKSAKNSKYYFWSAQNPGT